MSQVIAPINVHLHRFITQAEPNLPECVQKFLYLVLSLQDDGNTQFALNADSFYNKWAQKWNGLLKLYDTDSIEFEAGKFSDASEFKPIIESAIAAILKQKFESIIDWKPEDSEVFDDVNSKLFVASKSGNTTYLYIAKYFEAKRIIERTATTLFTDGSTPSESAIASCIEKIAQIHTKNLRFANKSNPEGKFLVNREQAEAIIRGQSENLIITGGPGTGKTTVVLYILWCMLESHPEYLDYEIYLAAPSGKAADRMRESLVGSLGEIEPNERENHADIFNKLSNLESSTIHRMLKYTPNDGGYRYNKKNPFGKNSIFVIDEASMIDISLFAAFLQAIQEGSRIFVLGDPYQLPSVEAGAVLGEILKPENTTRNFVVKLTKSNRFTDDSEIGRLAKAIQNQADIPFESGDAVKFINATTGTKKEEENATAVLVNEWVKEFSEMPALAEAASKEMDLEDKPACNRLWELSLQKRILSAERRGPRGVEKLNQAACKRIRQQYAKASGNPTSPANQYFPGEILILTRNQSMYKLYNGDTGIVIFKNGRPYLMIKRERFEFYPLSLLPADAIEPAFAITIHKSQGSEYNHVMMFLPTREGHPLLTNQILYTGITRAKKTVTIVASEQAFHAACTTTTQRDTGIRL